MSVDTSGLERRVQEYAQAKAQELAQRFAETVRETAPRATGELHDSIEVDDVYQTDRGWGARIVVGAPHARFVNDGTGVYGPEGTPILPTTPLTRDTSSGNGLRGGVLVFPAKIGPAPFVFARSVQGSEPTHFWERALDRWSAIVAELST